MARGRSDWAFASSATGRPSALVLSDHPAGDILCDEIGRCGGQSVRAVSFADLDSVDFGLVDGLVIDVRGLSHARFDRLVPWVAGIPSGLSWAVMSDMAGIDASFALVGDSGGAILLADDRAERLAGLADLFSRAGVADSGVEEMCVGMRHTDSDVAMIARRPAEGDEATTGTGSGASPRLGDPGRGFSAVPRFLGQGDDKPSLTAVELRRAIAMRRLRDRFFDESFFADPAWDILLDLAAARLEGGQVAVSSLCIAAAVPATTALRWIAAMTDRGLLERRDDPRDRRRVNVALSDGAFAAIQAYFAAVRAGAGLPS